MRSIAGVRLLAGLLGAVVVAVPSVFAQDAGRLDLSAGYLNVQRFMHGWNAQISCEATRRWLGIRAQGDWQIAVPDQSKWEGITIFPRVVAGAVIRLGSTGS